MQVFWKCDVSCSNGSQLIRHVIMHALHIPRKLELGGIWDLVKFNGLT
jgi:hypothetical protein